MTDDGLETHNDRDLLRSLKLLWLYVGFVVMGVVLAVSVFKGLERLALPSTAISSLQLVSMTASYLAVLFSTTTVFCMARSKLEFTAVWRMSSITSVMMLFTIPTLFYLWFLIGVGRDWSDTGFLVTLIGIPVLIAIWWGYTRSQLWLRLASSWNMGTKVALILIQLLFSGIFFFGIFGALYT